MSAVRAASADRSRERGQALVIVALAFAVILAAGGIGLDAGIAYVERRHEQVAADAAAYAAAVELVKSWSAPNRGTLATNAAIAYATANGYLADATTSVTVNNPPTSGAYAGNADYVEVLVRRDVRTTFVRILGPAFATQRVQARAVGGITRPAKPYAIIALSRAPGTCFRINGSQKAEVEAEGAGILANCTGPAALEAIGNSEIEVEPCCIETAGGASIGNNAELEPLPVRTNVPQIVDPLAYLVPPTGAGLPSFGDINVTNGTVTLSPGIYQSIRVSGNGKIKLGQGLPGQPSLYIIRGGGMSAIGNGRIEDSTNGDSQGVLVFNACSNFPALGGTCGSISVSGNGRIELEEEASGVYAGLSIWQPCYNTQPLSVSGNGTADPNPPIGGDGRDGDDDEDGELETSGTIYLPCAALDISGNGEVEVEDGQIVANTITVSGNGELEVEWESAVTSQVNRVPNIVE